MMQITIIKTQRKNDGVVATPSDDHSLRSSIAIITHPTSKTQLSPLHHMQHDEWLQVC